jgi:hypothetical protein
MELVKTNPERFRVEWNIPEEVGQLSAAVLEQPCVIFLMSEEQVIDFSHSSGADIVAFSRVSRYAFPMTVNGRHLGTLKIVHNTDETGRKLLTDRPEWLNGGGSSAGSGLARRILDLQQEYPAERGFVVCLLNAPEMGVFILIRRRGVTEAIAPASIVAGKALGLEEGRTKGTYPVISYGQAGPMLLEKAKTRARWLEENYPNLRQSDPDRKE